MRNIIISLLLLTSLTAQSQFTQRLSINGGQTYNTVPGLLDVRKVLVLPITDTISAYAIYLGALAVRNSDNILYQATGTHWKSIYNSPNLIGTPTVVTPSISDSSDKIVNSLWVKQQLLSRFTPQSVPFAGSDGKLTENNQGLRFTGADLWVGSSGFGATNTLYFNSNRGYLSASGFGFTIGTNGGLPTDPSKSINFYNSNFLYMKMWQPAQDGLGAADTLQTDFYTNVFPSVTNRYQFGKASNRWSHLFSRNVYTDSLFVNSGSLVTGNVLTRGIDGDAYWATPVGGGGLGSVTDVTATNATGQTWSISNSTTVPNISLTLTKLAVGLGNVDNTQDIDKPISTLTQTALNLKSNITSPVFAGVPTAPTAPVNTFTDQIATTAFTQNQIAIQLAAQTKDTTFITTASQNVLQVVSSGVSDSLGFKKQAPNRFIAASTDSNIVARVITNSDLPFQQKFGEESTGSTSSTIVLANTPLVATTRLYKNGIRLPSSQFSVTSATITLTNSRLSTDIFQIDYNY